MRLSFVYRSFTLTSAAIIAVILLAMPTCAQNSPTNPSRPIRVGIAWQPSADRLNLLISTIEAAGAQPVALPQMRPACLGYDNDRVSDRYVDTCGIILQQYADRIKRDTYLGTPAGEIMDSIDAVVFTGGGDISPTLFAQPEPWHGLEADRNYDAARDASEYLTMAYCLDHDIPALGLCRGMQMLGVISGATMIQDIPALLDSLGKTYNYLHRPPHSDNPRTHVPHNVTVTSRDSHLWRAVGVDTIRDAPSWHHQAIRSVSQTPLRVTGTTTDNGVTIIEAVERTDKRWVLGVQFHPETAVKKHLTGAPDANRYMTLEEGLAYFRALIRAARDKNDNKF